MTTTKFSNNGIRYQLVVIPGGLQRQEPEILPEVPKPPVCAWGNASSRQKGNSRAGRANAQRQQAERRSKELEELGGDAA